MVRTAHAQLREPCLDLADRVAGRLSQCLQLHSGRRTAARATREYARPVSPFPGCRKRDRGRYQRACEEMETSPSIHHAGTARSCPRCQLTTPTCANPSRLIQPAVLRTAPLTRQSQGRDPISPALNWGNVWQVQGSNLGRRSRRFYRPLPLATRATCQMPPCGAAERRIADNTTGCDVDPSGDFTGAAASARVRRDDRHRTRLTCGPCLASPALT